MAELTTSDAIGLVLALVQIENGEKCFIDAPLLFR